LQTAENVGVLRTNVIHHAGGYGYDIKPGDKAEKAKEMATEMLSKYDKDIDWVVDKFGSRSVSDLELLSTIVFVRDEGTRDSERLTQAVKAVKPHFSESQINRQIHWLKQERLLA
jgi:hypothetical protein